MVTSKTHAIEEEVRSSFSQVPRVPVELRATEWEVDVPRLSPAELQAARVRSGRLGGRPRKPSVEEARKAALEELVPRAVLVLRRHLGEGDEINPAAWRAALRVFEHAYGRAPEAVAEPVPFPDSPEAVAALSWEQMKVLAISYGDALANDGQAGLGAAASPASS